MNHYIQLHLLTAYPPSNPNRDDLGQPKTAQMGGVQRMRISSQSLKRAWRTSDLFESALRSHLGKRTRRLGKEAYQWLTDYGMHKKLTFEVAQRIAEQFGKLKKEKSKNDPLINLEIEQLVHVSRQELADIKQLCATLASEQREAKPDELKLLRQDVSSVDIALFGRMLAATPAFNVEAACQVSHAIGLTANTDEIDFFSAVDDINHNDREQGAGHIGEQRLGSTLYYTYLCLNRDLLLDNLHGDEALTRRAIAALLEAALKVTPGGKQNSFASRAYASYVLAESGHQQPRSLAVAFYNPLYGEQLLEQAIEKLRTEYEKIDSVYGVCADQRMQLNVAEKLGTFDELQEFVCTPLALV